MKNDPVNEVDLSMFAQIAYVNYDSILINNKKMRLSEVSALYEKLHEDDDPEMDKSANNFSPDLLKEMAASVRFKDLKMHSYVSSLMRDETEQFAAVIIDLPDHSGVVAFRGTDDTLIGWKEDFVLSYDDISSQYEAVDYVNKRCFPFKKYRFVGHSKGGYLAIYAAVHCKELIRRNLISIVSEDGPGLRPDSYEKEKLEQVIGRYILFVPEKDGVGVIYEMAQNKKVVKSSAGNLIGAHSMRSWQIDKNRFEEADSSSYESYFVRKIIPEILNDTSADQRRILVDEVFRQAENASITTLSQVRDIGLSIIVPALRKFGEMDDKAKETAGRILKTIYTSAGSELYDAVSRTNKKAIGKASDLVENVDQLIRDYLNNRKKDD